MSETQPGKGPLLSGTCHHHVKIRLSVMFNKGKTAQQQYNIEGKDNAIPLEVPCCTSQIEREDSLSSKLFFVVNCRTIHKKALTRRHLVFHLRKTKCYRTVFNTLRSSLPHLNTLLRPKT